MMLPACAMGRRRQALVGSLVDRVAVDAVERKSAAVEASAARYAEHVKALERRTDEDAAVLHRRLDVRGTAGLRGLLAATTTRPPAVSCLFWDALHAAPRAAGHAL